MKMDEKNDSEPQIKGVLNTFQKCGNYKKEINENSNDKYPLQNFYNDLNDPTTSAEDIIKQVSCQQELIKENLKNQKRKKKRLCYGEHYFLKVFFSTNLLILLLTTTPRRK